jgi:hypothetical protein
VSSLATGNRSYALAMIALVVFGLIGLAAAMFLPAKQEGVDLSPRPAPELRS